MGSKKTQHKSVKRYGTRYGRTIKAKAGKIESQQKADYICPKCRYKKVTRESAGIWKCGKCDAKFTSKAYLVAKLPTLKTEEVQ